MIKKTALLSIMFLLCFPFDGNTTCEKYEDDILGLAEKREQVMRQYPALPDNADDWDREWQAWEKAIEKIDSMYRKIIYDLLFEYEGKQTDLPGKCSDRLTKDKHLFLVVKLVEYWRSRDVENFLSDIPVDREGLSALWAIDTIVFRYPFYESIPHPKFFESNTFVGGFLDEIYQLAMSGNEIAIDNLLAMQSFADGEYGETMEEQIFRLIAERPKVVIANWSTIKKHDAEIGLSTTSYASHAEAIIKTYRDICKDSDAECSTCDQVLDFLKRKSLE
jgi:hypothetical protein